MDLAELIIRKMGIDPEQLKGAFAKLLTDAATVKGEVLGAKAGFIQVTGDFKTQLNRIENQNAEILRLLGKEDQNEQRQITAVK